MKAYYGSHISENIVRTPEGYLICLNVPIARTGSQQYLRSELGIIDDQPNGIIEIWRPEEEVFSAATIASFEGKPVTDEHPPDNLSLETVGAYECGHVQNVRRGAGNEKDCLLGDLFITSPKLIEAIEQRTRREVSCGYDCTYQEKGSTLYQTAIRGNHVAVVPAGRAGHRVAIKDSAAQQTSKERSKPNMPNEPKKNRSLFAKLFGIAVKDMEPDEIADAVEQLTQANDEGTPDPAPAASPAPAPTNDEEAPTLQGLLAAVHAIAEKVDALAAAAAQKPADEDPLQKLADEIAAAQPAPAAPANPADEEAAATIPADEMAEKAADEDGPKAAAETLPENPIPGADKAIAISFINDIKPIIAELPEDKRKAVSDKAIAQLRKYIGKDAKPQTDGYKAVNQVMQQAAKQKAKDSRPAVDQSKIGQYIMESRNPHYKKK